MAGPGFSEEQYYKKVIEIQQSIREREKRRLELERDLFNFAKSDKRIRQIKCFKLRSYLKEISDREARAKMRNLELQRAMERIEISMNEFSPELISLQQQKRKFLKLTEERAKPPLKHEATKVEDIQIKNPKKDTFHSPGEFKQPMAETFIDRRISRGSYSDGGSTSAHSHRALLRSPNRGVHSRQHLPSGLLKDFRVGREDAACKQTHLSDDISGSNGSLDGSNWSDKHERTVGPPPSVRTLTAAAGGEAFGIDDEKQASPLLTLTGIERYLSPRSSTPKRPASSPAAHVDSPEVSHTPPVMGDEQRGPGHLMAETTLEKEVQQKAGTSNSASSPTSDVRSMASSPSELSVSLTLSEFEDDGPENMEFQMEDIQEGFCSPKSTHSDDGPVTTSELHTESTSSKRLSMEGFFTLLDSIEPRLSIERICLYTNFPFDERQLNRITSLCDDGAGLNDEDLDACGAVVLRELPRLSRSTEKGCLLPLDVVRAHQSNPEPNHISASLPPNAARLWDRWFKHALMLKEQGFFTAEWLVQQFTPMLLERDATYSQQATMLLRTLLSSANEKRPPAADNNDLSSLFASSSAGREAEPVGSKSNQKLHTQELQSTEEDSPDESSVESGPIRESKAYQSLKQSAMQERQQDGEEEDDEDFTGINQGHEEDLGRAKRSSHQHPYPRNGNPNTAQSQAPWLDSDDSNAEIEAALRPQYS